MADDVISRANSVFDATRIVCSGISDEIAKISNISIANTAVSAAGTAASGGALAAGIAKSREEAEIDRLVAEICNAGGCTADGVAAMSDADFFANVMHPMAQIAELQQRIEKSKTLGNWRTGLMAGTIGTNLATAIMSGLNIDQSDLVQHVDACNQMLETIPMVVGELKSSGLNPVENPVIQKLDAVSTWCNKINIDDIEKIEKRMKAVMGTSIAGGAIGIVGTATSAVANSDKYMTMENKLSLSDADKKKEKALNTTANVMAGANVVTGGVEMGVSISLITLTKRLIEQSKRCEGVLDD